jgi:hypothetical protein
MRHVEVACTATKAVFVHKYTILLNRAIIWKMQAVPDLEAGESFNTFCTQPWFLYMRPSDGFISFGSAEPLGENCPVLAINLAGTPKLTNGQFLKGNRGFNAQTAGYTNYPLTALDMEMSITYMALGIKRQRTIHFVGKKNGPGFIWNIEPEGQGIPDDGEGGFRIETSGNFLELGIPSDKRPY